MVSLYTFRAGFVVCLCLLYDHTLNLKRKDSEPDIGVVVILKTPTASVCYKLCMSRRKVHSISGISQCT